MDAFAWRVLVSVLVGGTAVATFTTVAERGNPRLGGLLLSFPVKVTVALVLIALNEGVAFAATSATAVPAGLGVNLVFLVGTALLVRRTSPWRAIAGALALWALAGLAVILWLPETLAWSLALWVVVTGVALALLARVPRAPKKGLAAPPPLSAWRLGVRAIAAGSVVGGSLLVAHYAGPILGGLASVFPSGFITTMVVLTRRHGPEYTNATVRVMVAGAAAPTLFGVAVAFLYPALGVWLGTAASLALAGCTSFAVGWLLRREAAREAAPAPA